jgi:hypothetical protein
LIESVHEAACNRTDPVLANRLLRLRAPKGRLAIRYEAIVDIDQHREEGHKLSEVPVTELPFGSCLTWRRAGIANPTA